MKRAIGSLAALSLLLGLLAGPASAATFVPTKLKFTVSDRTPAVGQEVTFKGVLKASEPKCYAKRQIVMLKDGVEFKTKKTNSNGVVKWKFPVRSTAVYKLKFKGITIGAHPNEIVCEASKSRKWKVVVH